MDLIKISEELLKEIEALYQASRMKKQLMLPEKIKTLPFFVLIEVLTKIIEEKEQDPEKRKELFLKYYSVCLRGLNPFKDKELKSLQIDVKGFKKLLKMVAKDY